MDVPFGGFLLLSATTLLVISQHGRNAMKLPAYPTQFLACLEGNHEKCQHVDAPGLIAWVCQCECHPRELAAADNNYDRFQPLPEPVQEVLRYAGTGRNGVARGLRQCRECGELRGRYLLSENPLEWHLGFTETECSCEPRMWEAVMRDMAAVGGRA